MYQDLLDRFTHMCRETLNENLTGAYLHGSLAMGCFNPFKSDLDVLLVVKREPSDAEKLSFMERVVLFNEEAPPKGLELSIVTQDAVKPFVYPTPFVLHFSPMHLDWFHRDPMGYVQHMKGDDPDLAAHCTIIRRYGIVLWGDPINEVFGEIPRAAYLESIRQDVKNAQEDILIDPLYVSLNLCRVLAYAQDGLVLSKKNGGLWGLSHLPLEHHGLLRTALNCYGGEHAMRIEKCIAAEFAQMMLTQIEAACST